MFKVISYPFLVLWNLAQFVPYAVLFLLCVVFCSKSVKYTWKLGQ